MHDAREGASEGRHSIPVLFSLSHAFVEHLLCVEVYGAPSMTKTEVVSDHKLTFRGWGGGGVTADIGPDLWGLGGLCPKEVIFK